MELYFPPITQIIKSYLIGKIILSVGISIVVVYLLYKSNWKRKILDGESKEDYYKRKRKESHITHIAKNIKSILGYPMYKSKNDIVLIVGSFDLEHKSNIRL